jgi:hypothetical protein
MSYVEILFYKKNRKVSVRNGGRKKINRMDFNTLNKIPYKGQNNMLQLSYIIVIYTAFRFAFFIFL